MKSILLGRDSVFSSFLPVVCISVCQKIPIAECRIHQSRRSLFSADGIWTVNYSR